MPNAAVPVRIGSLVRNHIYTANTGSNKSGTNSVVSRRVALMPTIERDLTMWVGAVFPGDSNKLLQNVQFQLYGEMLLRLFSQPRDRYLDACRLIQIENDLASRLRSMKGFDHRTLQDIHDLIAAWFRFSQDNGGQLLLGETE